MVNGRRFARVVGGAKDLETIRGYLPSNYVAEKAIGDRPDVIIIGKDDHGWTLDGYVIPRLASGLIVAEEF
jgi:hypothetical protein